MDSTNVSRYELYILDPMTFWSWSLLESLRVPCKHNWKLFKLTGTSIYTKDIGYGTTKRIYIQSACFMIKALILQTLTSKLNFSIWVVPLNSTILISLILSIYLEDQGLRGKEINCKINAAYGHFKEKWRTYLKPISSWCLILKALSKY